LPDKAIDLIDEAGSRVRLRHAQVRIAMGKLSWVSMIINHTVNLLYVKGFLEGLMAVCNGCIVFGLFLCSCLRRQENLTRSFEESPRRRMKLSVVKTLRRQESSDALNLNN
jgi:hypothetical protein